MGELTSKYTINEQMTRCFQIVNRAQIIYQKFGDIKMECHCWIHHRFHEMLLKVIQLELIDLAPHVGNVIKMEGCW